MRLLRFLVRLLFLDWLRLLLGKPGYPYVPNLRESSNDGLFFESLTRGGLVIGRPGTGKTRWLAMQVLAYALENPDSPIFSLDASGSFTDDFIALYHQLPADQREGIDRRVVYDRPGDPNHVVPFPFLSPAYGLDYEDQVQRVAENFKSLFQDLVTRTPVMSLAITETLPELLRLLWAIQETPGRSWQITEAKKLLMDSQWLANACREYGDQVPEAKWYFEKMFLSDSVSDHERELRTFTLRSVLGVLEPRPVRTRVGFDQPGWTPLEAIAHGQIVLVSGEALINQPQAQEILFTDIFAQILAQVNRRVPHDPADKPILLTIDEVYALTRMPGMADELGKIPTQYRSRRLQMLVVIQALWQLTEKLQEQIWSLGNVTCFGVDDFNDAYTVAQQLFEYDPKGIRLPADTERDRPVMETERGQYLTMANWLQHLAHRACVMKRYRTEQEEEPFVHFIAQTAEAPPVALDESLMQIKERLHRRRAIPVAAALATINQRKMRHQPQKALRRRVKP